MVWFVIDGMDGSGKSTCAGLIEENLRSRNRSVKVCSHPDTSCIAGRLERRFLLGKGKISKILATVCFIFDVLDSLTGKWLSGAKYDDYIFVRYSMSAAYLSENSYKKAFGIIRKVFPEPDCAVLVDVDADSSMSRIKSRGEELEIFENREDLANTRRKMLNLSEGWHVIDNTRPPEEVSADLSDFVDRVLKEFS